MQGVLRDGTQVAIKCLSAESKQGANEFLTEINVISSMRHPNLVELIGCCVEDSHRILVYEYLENNSLASSLLGNYYNIEVFCCLRFHYPKLSIEMTYDPAFLPFYLILLEVLISFKCPIKFLDLFKDVIFLLR